MFNKLILNSVVNNKVGLTTSMGCYYQIAGFGWRPIQKPIKHWNIVQKDFVTVISGKYKTQ